MLFAFAEQAYAFPSRFASLPCRSLPAHYFAMPSHIKAFLRCTEPILSSSLLIRGTAFRCYRCFSLAAQPMLFHRLTVAIRFLALAPRGCAFPLRDPSALCRRAALLRLCTSLLGFASAMLSATSPPRPSALLCPYNPALCHAVCESRHTKLCLSTSLHCPTKQHHCRSTQTIAVLCTAFAFLGSQCNTTTMRREAIPSLRNSVLFLGESRLCRAKPQPSNTLPQPSHT